MYTFITSYRIMGNVMNILLCQANDVEENTTSSMSILQETLADPNLKIVDTVFEVSLGFSEQ